MAKGNTREYGWIDTKQASKILGMTQRGVQRYISGKYRAFKTRKFPVGKEFKYLIHIDDVLELKRTREQGKYLNTLSDNTRNSKTSL